VRQLVLVRHGESVWNAEARIQGQRCAGLSETGHRQAKLTGRALADAHPDARLVSSDLQRCQETTSPLAEALGVAPQLDRRLRERSFGAWEGRTRAEVADEDPDLVARWRDGVDVIGEVGGETAPRLIDRVLPALRELLDDTPDGGVTVAVTHGGPVWHGTHALLGLPAGTLGAVDNASVTVLASFGHGLVLQRWNETAHLPIELRTGWVPRLHRDDTSGDEAPPVGR
jgi:broad specificity phosphatase PhoE